MRLSPGSLEPRVNGEAGLEPKYPGAEGSSALAQGFLPWELYGFSLPGSLGGNGAWGLTFSWGPAAREELRALASRSEQGLQILPTILVLLGFLPEREQGSLCSQPSAIRFCTWLQRH